MINIGNIYDTLHLKCDIIGYTESTNSLGETIKSAPTVIYSNIPIVYKPAMSYSAVQGTQASQDAIMLSAHIPIVYNGQNINLTKNNKIRIDGIDYTIQSLMTIVPHNFYKINLVK